MFINATNRPIPPAAEHLFIKYGNELEMATGYSFRMTLDDDGDPQFWLVDPCGDTEGDCWEGFWDFKEDTHPVITEAMERQFREEQEAEAIPMADLV